MQSKDEHDPALVFLQHLRLVVGSATIFTGTTSAEAPTIGLTPILELQHKKAKHISRKKKSFCEFPRNLNRGYG